MPCCLCFYDVHKLFKIFLWILIWEQSLLLALGCLFDYCELIMGTFLQSKTKAIVEIFHFLDDVNISVNNINIKYFRLFERRSFMFKKARVEYFEEHNAEPVNLIKEKQLKANWKV